MAILVGALDKVINSQPFAFYKTNASLIEFRHRVRMQSGRQKFVEFVLNQLENENESCRDINLI